MALERRYQGEEPTRVNKWLAQEGVCSRREAEDLISRGAIRIDGEVVRDVGRKIEKGQLLTLNDRAEEELEAKLSVVLNKPEGFVSAQAEPSQLPAVVLLTRARLASSIPQSNTVIPSKRHRLAPLGRLDLDSRGLLILSEDGVLAKAIIGPHATIDKEYLVTVAGMITAEKLALLRHGLRLDGRALKPALVERVDAQVLRFVLTEGRNRQIRRMCDLVYLEVADLCRIRIGPVSLGDLKEGRWRPLLSAERAAIIGGV
jgi:23S rRNA pseudouridine2604 synthase